MSDQQLNHPSEPNSESVLSPESEQDPPRQFGTDWLNTVEERGRPPAEENKKDGR